jgi:hypothetical protein
MPEQLEDSIRATAPRPDPVFLEDLERRVEAGFPKPARKRRSSWLMRPAVPVLASALLALAVATAVISGDNGDDDAGGGEGSSAQQEPFTRNSAPQAEQAQGGGAADGALRDEPAPQTQGGAPSVAIAPSPGRPVAPGARRVVERSASLELRTGADDFGEVTAGVLRVADNTGTIVQRSAVSERDGRGFAEYDLRVPASRLDATLAELSRLADVRARTGSADDITGAFVSARDRLVDARDERRALLGALGRAETDAQRSAIRARLRDARRQIAVAERDVRRVRARTDRARVAVTVESTGRSGAWTPGDALDDAGRILEVAAGVLLVSAAVLVPLALLAAVAAAGAKVLRRRRREAALG